MIKQNNDNRDEGLMEVGKFCVQQLGMTTAWLKKQNNDNRDEGLMEVG